MQSLHGVCSLEKPKAVRQSLPVSPDRIRLGGEIFITAALLALDSMNVRKKMSWTCHGLELFRYKRRLEFSTKERKQTAKPVEERATRLRSRFLEKSQNAQQRTTKCSPRSAVICRYLPQSAAICQLPIANCQFSQGVELVQIAADRRKSRKL
jgi:hypothetical protein